MFWGSFLGLKRNMNNFFIFTYIFVAPGFFQSLPVLNCRIIESFGLEGTGFKGHLIQPPCSNQGNLQLDQIAQSLVPLDCGHLQGWGIYHLSGQLPPVLYTHRTKCSEMQFHAELPFQQFVHASNTRLSYMFTSNLHT